MNPFNWKSQPSQTVLGAKRDMQLVKKCDAKKLGRVPSANISTVKAMRPIGSIA